MPKPRISLIETLGLESYLDTTADQHLGSTYDDFVDLVKKQERSEDKPKRPADVDIADEFGVGSMTIGNWKKVYYRSKEEKV